jgi:hypothetical protein
LRGSPSAGPLSIENSGLRREIYPTMGPGKTFPALLRKSVTTGDICHSSMLVLRPVPLIVIGRLPIQNLTGLERCSISPPWKKTSECSVDRCVDRSHRKSPIMGPTPARELNRGGASAAIFGISSIRVLRDGSHPRGRLRNLPEPRGQARRGNGAQLETCVRSPSISQVCDRSGLVPRRT